jgi:hypothetical protein
MDHEITEIPPYANDGEEIADDPQFARKCELEASAIAKEIGANIKIGRLNRNVSFGLVWRADFINPTGNENFTNRIMLWMLPDGTFAKFVGSNLPSAPFPD